jgi:transposase
MRCKRCGYTFHDFTGRWINKSRITCRQWLLLIKYFEAEFSAKQITEKLPISYPTVLKALELLRLAIIANSSDASNWLDFVYFRAEEWAAKLKSHNRIAVFGIIDQRGRIKIDLLKGFDLQALITLNPKVLRKTNIFYTDECHPYDALVFHNFSNNNSRSSRNTSDRIYKINGKSGFWSYTKSKLLKHRGISQKKFPQYLKELEFRYNHRDSRLFHLLCQYLVSFIPSDGDLSKPKAQSSDRMD